jgi:hypothetical protein
MADVISFAPRADLAAAANMREFVRFCREDLTVFGASLDFDAPTWDVTDFYQHRGKSHRFLLNFVEHGPRHGALGRPMPEPFAMQVKAYLRYHAGLHSRRSSPNNEMIAFRALLAAFQDKAMVPDLGSVDTQVLDHAVQLAAARKAATTELGSASMWGLSLGFLERKTSPHSHPSTGGTAKPGNSLRAPEPVKPQTSDVPHCCRPPKHFSLCQKLSESQKSLVTSSSHQ